MGGGSIQFWWLCKTFSSPPQFLHHPPWLRGKVPSPCGSYPKPRSAKSGLRSHLSRSLERSTLQASCLFAEAYAMFNCSLYVKIIRAVIRSRAVACSFVFIFSCLCAFESKFDSREVSSTTSFAAAALGDFHSITLETSGISDFLALLRLSCCVLAFVVLVRRC